MRKEGAALRTFHMVAIALLVMAISIGAFSYLYVMGKEDYFSKRDFRLLAVQSTQFKQRIDNYTGSVLPNLVDGPCKPQGTLQPDPCGIAALAAQLKTLPALRAKRSEAEASAGQGGPPRAEVRGEGEPAASRSGAAPGENLEEIARGTALEPLVTKVKANLEKTLLLARNLKLDGDVALVFDPTRSTRLSLKPLQAAGEFQLAFNYQRPVLETQCAARFRMVARMDSLVGTIPGQVFDDTLLVRPQQSDNQVIFQQAPSGPRFAKLGAAQNTRGETTPFTAAMSTSDVYRLNLAGTQYRLFVQPVRLSVFESSKAESKTEPDEIWSLCGLVRADRFRSDSLAISYSLLLLFLFLFALVLSSWPLLKLWSLGPADRLQLADVILVSMSVCMLSVLVTFFLLDLYAKQRLDRQLDEQLRLFAGDMERRFDRELGQLCGLLKHAEDAARTDPGAVRQRVLCAPGTGSPSSPCRLPDWLDANDPYFEMITWVGTTAPNDGMQVRKWTIEDTNTPLINVGSRDYFRRIKEGRGWTKKLNGRTSTFYLDPILSLNTGEVLSELSMPDPAALAGAVPEHVITVTARLRSLRDVVLPPGFGYAVIDEGGRVLFHSDPGRSLLENFFQECDDDSELRASVYARDSDWVNAPYTGRDHRLFILPLRDLPLTLVVFRDKGIARTVNLELLSAALIFYAFYGTVFLLLPALVCLWHPDWMWPHAERSADYRHLLAANLVLIALSLTDLFFRYRHHIPSLAFLLPPFALLMNYLKLREKGTSVPVRRHPLLLVLTALPILQLALGLRDSSDAGQPLYFLVTIFQVMVLYLVFDFIFYPGRSFFPKVLQFVERHAGKRLRFSAASLLLGVSLVVITGVLPALALFRMTCNAEMEVLIKHGQLNLAHALVARDARVKRLYRQVAMPSNYLDRWLRDTTVNLYSGFFFHTRFVWDPTPRPVVSINPPPKGLFDLAMEKIRPLYNEVAVQTHELVHDEASDNSYQWESDETGQIRLAQWPAPDAFFREINSDVPVLGWPRRPWWTLGLAAAALFFLLGIYVLVRFVANKIFLPTFAVSLRGATEVTDLGEVAQNTLVLGPPHGGKTRLLSRPDFQVVDIRPIATAWTWESAITKELPDDKRVIAVDHFDFAMDDPECNVQKLRLLENYLLAKRRLVVASSIDPMDFPVSKPGRKGAETKEQSPGAAAPNAAGNHLGRLSVDRWAAVWSTFTRSVYAAKEEKIAIPENDLEAAIACAGAPQPKSTTLFRECRPTEPLRRIGVDIAQRVRGGDLEGEPLIEEVRYRARAYYWALWAACVKEERRALFYLAEDGFVSAANLVLPRLLERGLVVAAPRPRLVNESFRRFVVEVGRSEDVAAVPEESWNLKRVIRGTVVTAMIGLAVVLFVTQPELLNFSTTFIGTAAVSIPAVLKLFDLVRGSRSAP